MATTRPTAVTVMAILNIVFASLGMLCYVCIGIVLLVLFNNQSIFAVAGVPVFTDMWDFMKREVPSYPAVTIGSLILSLVLTTVLLISGIGLLNLRGWARVMAIVYSILTILLQVSSVVYTVAVVNPATRRWQEDFQRRLNLPPGAGGGGFSNDLSSLIGAVIGVAYAIILLIMMLTPNVSAAFSGRRPPDDYGRDRYDRGGPDVGGPGRSDQDDDRFRGQRNAWDY
jgi:hypothetical protein